MVARVLRVEFVAVPKLWFDQFVLKQLSMDFLVSRCCNIINILGSWVIIGIAIVDSE